MIVPIGQQLIQTKFATAFAIQWLQGQPPTSDQDTSESLMAAGVRTEGGSTQFEDLSQKVDITILYFATEIDALRMHTAIKLSRRQTGGSALIDFWSFRPKIGDLLTQFDEVKFLL